MSHQEKANHWFLTLVFVCLAFYMGQIWESIPTSMSRNNPPVSSCDRPEINRDNIRIKVNERRLEAKSRQASDSDLLQEYAQLRAEEIGEAPIRLSHETQYEDFLAWAEKNKKNTDIFNSAGGELLVTGSKDACDAIQGLMESPTHKDGMLDPNVDEMGYGIKGDTVVIITADRN